MELLKDIITVLVRSHRNHNATRELKMLQHPDGTYTVRELSKGLYRVDERCANLQAATKVFNERVATFPKKVVTEEPVKEVS